MAPLNEPQQILIVEEVVLSEPRCLTTLQLVIGNKKSVFIPLLGPSQVLTQKSNWVSHFSSSFTYQIFNRHLLHAKVYWFMLSVPMSIFISVESVAYENTESPKHILKSLLLIRWASVAYCRVQKLLTTWVWTYWPHVLWQIIKDLCELQF